MLARSAASLAARRLRVWRRRSRPFQRCSAARGDAAQPASAAMARPHPATCSLVRRHAWRWSAWPVGCRAGRGSWLLWLRHRLQLHLVALATPRSPCSSPQPRPAPRRARRLPAVVRVWNGRPDLPARCMRAACRRSVAWCWSSVSLPAVGPVCSRSPRCLGSSFTSTYATTRGGLDTTHVHEPSPPSEPFIVES